MSHAFPILRNLLASVIALSGTVALAEGPAGPNHEPGLLTSAQTGMPAALWIDETTGRVANLMQQTDPAELPSNNALLMSLTLSESYPALNAANHEILGTARLNFLWRSGALDAAEELSKLYSLESPLIRSEVETIALLSTRPESYCEGLIADEYQEIQNGMKVYCYVRADNYEAALAEFEEISPRLSTQRRALLERFLDINEDDPLRDQPWIELPPPFEFVLDEAIGRPRGLKQLPPAYNYYSRESGVTPRSDLEISEELAHLGALPPAVLFAAYRDNQAAESGGAWGRAQAVQWLDALDEVSDEAEIERVLTAGHERFSANDTEQLFAQESREKLIVYDPLQFNNKALAQDYVRMAVLGGWSKPEWQPLINRNNPDLMLAFLLAQPQIDVDASLIFTNSALARIIKPAFFGSDFDPLEAKSFGEAIWQSVFVIDNYKAHPEYQVSGAFQSLIISGLEDDARSIAIALLLSDQP